MAQNSHFRLVNMLVLFICFTMTAEASPLTTARPIQTDPYTTAGTTAAYATTAPPEPEMPKSLAKAVVMMYNSIHKFMGDTKSHFQSARSEIKKTGSDLRKTGNEVKNIDSKLTKMEEKQSKIIRTVEHFKDINGTKIFDLVNRFNRFQRNVTRDISTFKKDVSVFKSDTVDKIGNSTAAIRRLDSSLSSIRTGVQDMYKKLSGQLKEITKKLDQGVDDVFVYYPRHTAENMAQRRYTDYRLQFTGYGYPYDGYSRRTIHSCSLDHCLKFCQSWRKYDHGYNGLTYNYSDNRECVCYKGDNGRLDYGNQLHYMFF